MLIAHMKQGYSLESFAAVVGKCFKTIHTWRDSFPEFAAAAKAGRSERLKFFETIGIMKVRGKKTTEFDPKLSCSKTLEFFLKTGFHEFYSVAEKPVNPNSVVQFQYKNKEKTPEIKIETKDE